LTANTDAPLTLIEFLDASDDFKGARMSLGESPSGAKALKNNSVRFYDGKLDGQQATIIFYAERDFSELSGPSGLAENRPRSAVITDAKRSI
jgi:hypothetical protein